MKVHPGKIKSCHRPKLSPLNEQTWTWKTIDSNSEVRRRIQGHTHTHTHRGKVSGEHMVTLSSCSPFPPHSRYGLG